MYCRGCGTPFPGGEDGCAKCGWKGSPGGSPASGPSEKLDRPASPSPGGITAEAGRTALSETAASPLARLAGALALVGLFVVAIVIFLRRTPSDDASSPIFGGELGKDELVRRPAPGAGSVPAGGELLDVLPQNGKLIKLSPSSDGRHVSYLVAMGPWEQHRNYVVNDGIRSEDFEAVAIGTPAGADWQSGVWVVHTHEGDFLLQDGMKRGEKFPSIENVTLDPESRRVASVASLGPDRYCVVLDGWKGEEFERIGRTLILSKGGLHLAFAGRRGGRWYPVWDGRPGPPSDELGEMALSPDGRRLSFWSKTRDVWSLTLDGKTVVTWNGPGPYPQEPPPPIFSPDGRRVAFVTMKDSKTAVLVVDGAEVRLPPGADFVREVVFSPDSTTLAYVVQTPFKAEGPSNATFVVSGDREYGPFREAKNLLFSPDSAHLAFVAQRAGEPRFIAMDGVKDSLFEASKVQLSLSSDALMQFSPDGRHFAYVALQEDGKHDPFDKTLKPVVVVDSRKVGCFDDVHSLRFSADGKHVAYIATDEQGGKKKQWVVLDGIPGEEFDWVVMPVFYEGGRELRFTGVRGPEIWRIHQALNVDR